MVEDDVVVGKPGSRRLLPKIRGSLTRITGSLRDRTVPGACALLVVTSNHDLPRSAGRERGKSTRKMRQENGEASRSIERFPAVYREQRPVSSALQSFRA